MAQHQAARGRPHEPPTTVRDELLRLATVHSGRGDDAYLPRQHRPLGALSDFVCEGLGDANDAVRRRDIAAEDLLRVVEDLSRNVDDDTMQGLAEDTAARRVASLDLAFAERAVDIAHGQAWAYRERRRGLDVFQKAEALAELDGRYPMLGWSDIAIGHPLDDPRSFLDPSGARDQEILMYRIQSGIERAFKRLVTQWPDARITAAWLSALHADLDAVVAAMTHLTRVREPGQFYKLDPFLGANGATRGHGTGAFSAWTFLAGWYMTGREEFRSRLCDPQNLRAFDPDSRLYIRTVACLGVATLPERAAQGMRQPMEIEAVQARFYDFLKIHRGAVRKHAPASFADAAPASPLIDNAESMRRSLQDTRKPA
jgi:hypothetical protein